MQHIDPQRCPLCEQPNACGQLSDPGKPCWCFSITIAPEQLAAVPVAERHLACLCRSCASGHAPSPTPCA